jgi:hypothetical protein
MVPDFTSFMAEVPIQASNASENHDRAPIKKKSRHNKKRGVWLSTDFQPCFAKALSECIQLCPVLQSGTKVRYSQVMQIKQHLFSLFKERAKNKFLKIPEVIRGDTEFRSVADNFRKVIFLSKRSSYKVPAFMVESIRSLLEDGKEEWYSLLMQAIIIPNWVKARPDQLFTHAGKETDKSRFAWQPSESGDIQIYTLRNPFSPDARQKATAVAQAIPKKAQPHCDRRDRILTASRP